VAGHPFLEFAILPVLAWAALVPARRIQRRWLRVTAMSFTGFVAAMSTCQLLVSLGEGSVDISDLWLFSPYPWLLSLPVIGIGISFLAKLRWIRISGATISSLLLIPSGLAALLFCITDAGCTIHKPAIYAPDGKHIALVEFFTQGALGADGATVSVRRAWWPFGETVYSGFAESPSIFEAASPEVLWLDSSHLLIRYRTEGKYAPVCMERAEPVRITCEKTNTEILNQPGTAQVHPSVQMHQP
jgi:hypothetical protein